MKKKKSNSLLPAIVANLVSFYAHFCGYLTRYIHTGNKEAMAINEKQKVIYAFWHNQQAFLLFPYRKRGKVAVLVSMSKDGEFMAKSLPKFNMTAVRGSSSRGGAGALRNLMDAAQKGFNLALTPDGPRGPLYKAQPGILYLAQKTGMTIIAAGVASSNKFAVNSWDKFQIPLPFGKCAIVYGEPLKVGANDDISAARKQLTKILTDATSIAQELVNK